jgi:drug/metabolite transporter (DMT)-like permease
MQSAIKTSMGLTEWAMLIVLSILWGGSFFFIEVAVKTIQPFTLVLARVSLGALILALVLLATRQRFPLNWPVAAAFLVLALLNNAIPFSLFAWGQTQIASGLASILNATTPLWAVVVAHFFTEDERASPLKVAGVAIGFGGVALMIGGDFLLQIGGAGLLAQFACVVATLCYALAGVYSRRFRRMCISPIAVAAGQLGASVLLMLPLVLMFETPWNAPAPPGEAIGSIIALAVFSTALAYILYFRLIATAGATNAILVTFLIPATAILLGSTLLGEVLAPRHFFGMALIGGGLAAIDGRLPRRLLPMHGA